MGGRRSQSSEGSSLLVTFGFSRSCSPEGEPAPQPTSIAPPRDLVISEVTARSFRVKWTHASGQVEKYRVVYYPASGGQPDEKVCENSRHVISLFWQRLAVPVTRFYK